LQEGYQRKGKGRKGEGEREKEKKVERMKYWIEKINRLSHNVKIVIALDFFFQ